MQLQPEEIKKVEDKIRRWSQDLQDMSGRNRLLFYKETKSSTATIELPEFYPFFEMLVERGSDFFAPLPDPKEAKSIFGDDQDAEQLTVPMSTKKQKVLKESEIQTNHTVSGLNKALYNLRYTARTIQEEQGFNVVYATFGMLKWREAQAADFSYAPLILVPILIEREGVSTPYKISMAEDEIVLNPVLITKLAKDFNLQLPEITNDLTSGQLQEFLAQTSQLANNHEGWEVLEKTTIGAFNFLTMLLIKDFENHFDLYVSHPVIHALSGLSVEFNPPGVNPVMAKELDDVVDPSTTFQIMDADSSQQEAIEAAKRGLSFVLQGPPGTGKSQTIANIIAEFLMAGKKVLFVSQKMAALEVVQNRLSQKGLGEFCLEAHSHKMDKRKVIEDLMHSLSGTLPPTRITNSYHLLQEEIKKTKSALNFYAQQIHEKNPVLDITLYEVYGKIASLLDSPQVNFYFNDVEKVTINALNKVISLIREVTTYSIIISTFKNNRWRGCKISKSSIQERERLSDLLNQSGNGLNEFYLSLKAITNHYSLPEPETILDCFNYLTIFTNFKPEVFSEGRRAAVSNYVTKYNSFSRFFDFQYWKDSANLRSVYIPGGRPKPETVLPVLKNVIAVQKKMETSGNFEDQYSIDIDNLTTMRNSFMEGVTAIKEIFSDEKDWPEQLRLGTKQSPDKMANWFLELEKNTGELADWANFNSTVSECHENGLGDFVQKSIESELPILEWEKSFLRRFYLLLEENIVSKRPLLQQFRGTSHTSLVQRFRELDITLIDGAPHVIKENLYQKKPQGAWIQASSAETTILKREHNKKRRVMPLRRLFHEIPNLIQALKPCLMMSPLTVCQLLDPQNFIFDLVIFDEASQIPPEYAIGAFMRSRQVIVAGDRQQLPPTNFFRNIEADDYEDYDDETSNFEENVAYESILNACDSSGFLSQMLNWHYRSKDESLITFSNYHFYDNRLFTFPGPNSSTKNTGLKFVHVKDGVYKRGAGSRFNLIEAGEVAQLVREHLLNTPELSLGIVTFSMSQRKAIEAAIEKMRIENPELNARISSNLEEPMFIKNLENVQGDERDVIILSVGYGKDEAGKMAMNFGPINREGGARRLNVAVTRARYALKLVASIMPEDIDITRTNSLGAKLLRNYLEAARDGSIAIYKDETVFSNAEFDSPFEESVYKELERRNIKLIPQVGVSNYRIDLAVVDQAQPGRFLLGIECDGAMYHSASTARDRDRLRQQVLEGLGWKIHRIWSRDWIQNRQSEIDKILLAISNAKNGIPGQSEISSKKKVTNYNFDQINIEKQPKNSNANIEVLQGAMPYKQFTLEKQPVLGGEALLRTSTVKIVEAFEKVVRAEGPISIRVAKDRILEAWGTRKGSRIDEYLGQSINYGKSQNRFTVKGDFLWPIGMNIPPLRIQTDGQTFRNVEDISPEELIVAAIRCTQNALGLQFDDLARETLKLFGLSATRDNLLHITSILDHLISIKILRSENGKVSMTKTF